MFCSERKWVYYNNLNISSTRCIIQLSIKTYITNLLHVSAWGATFRQIPYYNLQQTKWVMHFWTSQIHKMWIMQIKGMKMTLELQSVWIPSSYFNLHNVVNTESSFCVDKAILFKTLLDVIGVIPFNELLCTCFKDYVPLLWMTQLHLLRIKFLYERSKMILPWTKGMQTKTQSNFQDIYPIPRTREQQHVLYSPHGASATLWINSHSTALDSSNNVTFIN